jgi:N-acyl-D-aspartate/D-glutamate deacylase
VRIKAKQEGDEQMMRVPESLKRLLADHTMCSGIHQEHTQKHDMASDSTGFSVVDLNCRNRTKLIFLDIEEAVTKSAGNLSA